MGRLLCRARSLSTASSAECGVSRPVPPEDGLNTVVEVLPHQHRPVMSGTEDSMDAVPAAQGERASRLLQGGKTTATRANPSLVAPDIL